MTAASCTNGVCAYTSPICNANDFTSVCAVGQSCQGTNCANTDCTSSGSCTSGYCKTFTSKKFCVACTQDTDCGANMKCASSAPVTDWSTGTEVTYAVGQCYAPTCNTSTIAGSTDAGFCERLPGSSGALYMAITCGAGDTCISATCAAPTLEPSSTCYSGYCNGTTCAPCSVAAADGSSPAVGCNSNWQTCQDNGSNTGMCEANNCDASTPCATGLCVASTSKCGACSSNTDCQTNLFSASSQDQVGTCDTATGFCSYTSTCTINSDCGLSKLCQSSTTDGTTTKTCAMQCSPPATDVADSCTQTTNFAADDLAQVGTCGTAANGGTVGTCSYSSACANADGTAGVNSLCQMSNFCDATAKTCMICDTTVAANSCSNAVFAASTENQVGTCTNGMCSFSNVCAANSDCIQSMQCTKATMTCAAACTAASADGTTPNSCTTAVFGTGVTAQVGTCGDGNNGTTTGQCSYTDACMLNTSCASSQTCTSNDGSTAGTCLAVCDNNSQCGTVNLCNSSTKVCAAACTATDGTTPSSCTNGIVSAGTQDQVGECNASGACVYTSTCSSNDACIGSGTCAGFTANATGTCTAGCKVNTDCSTGTGANASGLCIMGTDATAMGVCTTCSADVSCASGVLPANTNDQVGTCGDGTASSTLGVCTFSATCETNSDCKQSMLCVNVSTAADSTDLQCRACMADSTTVNCTTNGTFATGDVKTTGTCTNGQCQYVQSCTDNSNCASSNLCVASVCSDKCSDDASCMTGTANSDDWEGTCNTTTGMCSFEETGLSGGAIAGIVIGSVVFVLLVVVGIYFCTKQSGETDSSKAVAYETLHENH
jgi:hypothetical protein